MNNVNTYTFRNTDYIYSNIEDYKERIYYIMENVNKMYILNLTNLYTVFINEITEYDLINYPTDIINLFSFIIDYIICTNERPDTIETEEIAYDIDHFAAYTLISYKDEIIHNFIYEQIDLYDRIRTELKKLLYSYNINIDDIIPDEWVVVKNSINNNISLTLKIVGV